MSKTKNNNTRPTGVGFQMKNAPAWVTKTTFNPNKELEQASVRDAIAWYTQGVRDVGHSDTTFQRVTHDLLVAMRTIGNKDLREITPDDVAKLDDKTPNVVGKTIRATFNDLLVWAS